MADKSAHKAKVRDRILDEAARALRSGGTEGLSVANLMKRAGLTHGGFYAHFENRDDLVVHAVDRMFQDSAGMLRRFLPDGAGPAGVAALVDNYLSERAMRRSRLRSGILIMTGRRGEKKNLWNQVITRTMGRFTKERLQALKDSDPAGYAAYREEENEKQRAFRKRNPHYNRQWRRKHCASRRSRSCAEKKKKPPPSPLLLPRLQDFMNWMKSASERTQMPLPKQPKLPDFVR